MAYIDEVLADSPVVVFPMDEASGNLVDLVAAKSGVAAGTPTYGVTGPVVGHTAIVCDAAGDYFAVADHADLDLADGPFTVEIWARRDTDTANWEIVLSKGTNGYQVGVTNGDQWFLAKDNIATIARSSTSVPATGTWHHYAVTRNGTASGNSKVYVDGSDVTVEGTIASVIADTANALQIGRDEVGDPPFLGGLAYLAIYKSVLSAARIAAHYAAASVPPATDSPFPFVGGGYYG